MDMNGAHEDAAIQSADEMLTKVRKDLVGIHAAIDSRTRADTEIMSWTLRELMDLIREIRSFQQEQRASNAGEPSSSVTR
jgi:hypothetical protein